MGEAAIEALIDKEDCEEILLFFSSIE